MKVIKPPSELFFDSNEYTIFLAGSIEMGNATEWQKEVEDEFEKFDTKERIVILNPRRDDWDSSWEQSAKNKQFSKQVNWELSGLECCDFAIVYFDPNTKSPISLMELGLFKDKRHIIVCCPEGFWRKGNVDIVCNRYGIKVMPSLKETIEEVKKIITEEFYRYI